MPVLLLIVSRQKLSYLLITLPDLLDHITETVHLIPEELCTADYVKENKLLLCKEIKDDVLNANTECYRCHAKGHIAGTL